MSNTDDARSTSERPVPARRLRVLVGSLPIEDGQLRPPARGQVCRLTLTFVETDGRRDDRSVSAVRARAEPLADGTPQGPGRGWDGVEREGPVTWPTVLHGDGWSATWSAPRPVIGQVELTGRLVDNLDIGVRTGTRGRVTRVRVVTETVDTSDPDQATWRPIPGQDQLHDVEVAPRWFDHGLVAPPGALDDPSAGGFTFFSPVPADPWVREIGVLVDLDLDDVPPLPTRPRVVPGALAAHGGDLWVLDERLPLLLRVRHARTTQPDGPEVSEFAWAGRILSEPEAQGWMRALHADADGCWITGPDGLHRAHSDTGTVEQVDPDQTGAILRDGEFTRVVTDPATATGRDRRARLQRRRYPGPGVEDLDLGEGHVEGLVATSDGGLLALRRHLPHGVALIPHRQPAWLTAISPDDTVTHGPHLEIAGSLYSPLFPGHPPIIDDSRASPGALRRVRGDLTVDDGVSSARMLLGTYTGAGRLWVLAHPPHPDTIARGGPDACWPLGAPPVYPEDRQYWLLTELDPTTLQPLISHLVPDRPGHLSVDGHGTVWVLADGLRHLPDADGATATPLHLEHLTPMTPHRQDQPGAA